MSTFLKSKKLYDSSSKRAFHHTNLSTFKNIIQEYQKYLGKNNISNYNKINDYVDIDSIYHHIDSPCFFCEKYYPDFNLAKLQESARQLQNFYHWLVKYSEFIDQPNQHDFKKPAFPFALKYFSIANFQCIKYIEEKIPIDAQFIVFFRRKW